MVKAGAFPCPCCPRAFGDANARYQHARYAHPTHAIGQTKPPRRTLSADPAMAIAESASDAWIKSAAGRPLDECEESLLP